MAIRRNRHETANAILEVLQEHGPMTLRQLEEELPEFTSASLQCSTRALYGAERPRRLYIRTWVLESAPGVLPRQRPQFAAGDGRNAIRKPLPKRDIERRYYERSLQASRRLTSVFDLAKKLR